MLKKIKILPNNIANKIAAGEVVQRPESVVKELLENSIDAEAKNIELFVKRAGKTLIQVVDDGTGMSQDDALTCLERHATSKIDTFEDLNRLQTYGFRGEALSSVAAVSIFELKTERKEDEIGTLVRVAEDGQIKLEKGSFAKGTSIAVKNLFFNTPARRHFLKSNATELKHIIETFKKIALSNSKIHFKMWNDDDLIFDFDSGDFKDRMKAIFADNILDAVIEVKEITDYISVKGFVAKPTFVMNNKGVQYLYINDRYVISRTVNHAVFSAYENILTKGDYPFFVLMLTIDPKKIDVNVHPAKLEVKFDDEKDIYSFIHAVVKKSLGHYDHVPSMTFDTSVENKERLRFNSFNKTEKNDFSDRPVNINNVRGNIDRKSVFSEDEIDLLFGSMNKEIKSTSSPSNLTHPFDVNHSKEVYHSTMSTEDITDKGSNSSFIVLLHNKYILSQIKSGLMIIDQHVAHERILYEKALKSMSNNMPFSQQLLFSQKVRVDPADYELLKELENHLNNLGFAIKFFSKNTIVIDGVPPDVKVGLEVNTLLDILNEYRKNQRQKGLDVKDNIAKSYSCKAAIKAGDKISEHEMRLLVDQLFATSMPYVCPHGRPIVIKIPLEELDKRFGRT